MTLHHLWEMNHDGDPLPAEYLLSLCQGLHVELCSALCAPSAETHLRVQAAHLPAEHLLSASASSRLSRPLHILIERPAAKHSGCLSQPLFQLVQLVLELPHLLVGQGLLFLAVLKLL